ncbi:uncharacterized protein LOC115895204 [Rhinopithecus roxellana]|uniref:uncharacterized protein LOC115895204 n=1 Tax=Rhinopithecus roxellana TaxID=61622 RepID=UPI0012378E3D|nr:uncharacterized protein LOC115895204 [Rhinopithecus roxellana]
MAASGPGGPGKTPGPRAVGSALLEQTGATSCQHRPQSWLPGKFSKGPTPLLLEPLIPLSHQVPQGPSSTQRVSAFPVFLGQFGLGGEEPSSIHHTPDPNRPKARRSRVGPEAVILPAQGAQPKVSTRSPRGTAVCRSPEAPNNDSAPESGHQALVPCEAASTCLGSFQGPSEGPVTAAPSHSPSSWGPALLWIPARQQPACGLRCFRSCCTTGKGLEAGSWRWPQRRLAPSPPGQPSSPGHEGLRLTPRRKCPVLRESSEGLPAGNQDPVWPKPGPATMVRQSLQRDLPAAAVQRRWGRDLHPTRACPRRAGSQYLHISGRKGPEALGSRGCALRK